jgi:hypothetical protein
MIMVPAAAFDPYSLTRTALTAHDADRVWPPNVDNA